MLGLFMREAKDIIWLLRRMPKIMIQTVLLLVRRFNCSPQRHALCREQLHK